MLLIAVQCPVSTNSNISNTQFYGGPRNRMEYELNSKAIKVYLVNIANSDQLKNEFFDGN